MRHTTLTLTAAIALLAGCVHPALERFRGEHGCRDASVVDLGGHAFRVRGCGRSVIYVCRGRLCVTDREEEAPEPVTPATPSRARISRDRGPAGERVSLTLSHFYDVELLYAPDRDRDHVLVTVYEPQGRPACDQIRIEGARASIELTRIPGVERWLRADLSAMRAAVPVAVSTCQQTLHLSVEEVEAMTSFLDQAQLLREDHQPEAPRDADPTAL